MSQIKAAAYAKGNVCSLTSMGAAIARYVVELQRTVMAKITAYVESKVPLDRLAERDKDTVESIYLAATVFFHAPAMNTEWARSRSSIKALYARYAIGTPASSQAPRLGLRGNGDEHGLPSVLADAVKVSSSYFDIGDLADDKRVSQKLGPYEVALVRELVCRNHQ